jgi:DUF4097 and DUF4098 domain-containing protein YvlB
MKLSLAALPVAAALVATPALAAPKTTDLTVKGPVKLEVASVEVSLVVKRGAKGKARVVADLSGGIMGKAEAEVTLRGNALEIDGLDPTVKGTITVELPPGSSVEAESVTGGMSVSGMAEAELSSVTGGIKTDGTDVVEVESVNGGVELIGGKRHRVEAVNGGVTIAPAGVPDVEASTVAGGIAIRGLCGKGCRIRFESVSGEIRLALDRKSSFEARFESFAGKLDDKLGLTLEPDQDRDERAGRYGKGEGSIEGESFSGRVVLTAP